MAARTTYKKRQKELARQEKQREKAAKRVQRKLDKQSGVTQDSDAEDTVLEAPLDSEVPQDSEAPRDSEDPASEHQALRDAI